MCPACIASAALLAAGTASAGGLVAVVVKKLRPKPGVLDGKAQARPARRATPPP